MKRAHCPCGVMAASKKQALSRYMHLTFITALQPLKRMESQQQILLTLLSALKCIL